MHNFGTQTQKNNNTSFGANLSSTGIQHGNRLQLFVTMSTVTCFILRAHTGTGVRHNQHRKKEKIVRGFVKNAGE